jgi:hypothetical protein
VTEMYSPVPIENAPATSAATPVSTTAWDETPPPPTPAISEALVTSPSTAPNTVGRSHPPETSRWRCDQPARNAAAPVACDGSRTSSSATAELSPSPITPQLTVGGPGEFRPPAEPAEAGNETTAEPAEAGTETACSVTWLTP